MVGYKQSAMHKYQPDRNTLMRILTLLTMLGPVVYTKAIRRQMAAKYAEHRQVQIRHKRRVFRIKVSKWEVDSIQVKFPHRCCLPLLRQGTRGPPQHTFLISPPVSTALHSVSCPQVPMRHQLMNNKHCSVPLLSRAVLSTISIACSEMTLALLMMVLPGQRWRIVLVQVRAQLEGSKTNPRLKSSFWIPVRSLPQNHTPCLPKNPPLRPANTQLILRRITR
mmetsp:Transcript_424/g.779  ORF Transcript_424/g.779 Transcript_424/m.779 type:complete len:222 (+) Transcript_424:337-1002(+)